MVKVTFKSDSVRSAITAEWPGIPGTTCVIRRNRYMPCEVQVQNTEAMLAEVLKYAANARLDPSIQPRKNPNAFGRGKKKEEQAAAEPAKQQTKEQAKK